MVVHLPLLQWLPLKQEKWVQIPPRILLRGIIMHSKAFKEFKREVGQANHYFITIVVGLYAVKNGAKKDDEIHECWNPKDIKASFERSYLYARKTALAWCVDNLDRYFRQANRVPCLYDSELKNRIDGSQGHNQSVSGIFRAVCDYFPDINMTTRSLVNLLIAWRNRMVHYDARNPLDNEYRDHLLSLEASNPIIEKYHLDIRKMLKSFDDNKVPSNKELETMLSYTMRFVEELDSKLIEKLDKRSYIDSIIAKALKEGNNCTSYFTTNGQEKKMSIIKKWLSTVHCIEDSMYDEELDKYLGEIVMKNKTQLVDYYSNL